MKRIADLILLAAAGGLVLMTVIVGWQVFGRFILDDSPSWTEQAALLLMVWYVMMAAAVGVREGFHIRIDLLEEALSERRARALRGFAHAVVLLCGVVFLVWGAQLSALVWDHRIPSLGLSRGVAYVPIALSGLLISLFAADHLRREWRGDTEPRP